MNDSNLLFEITANTDGLKREADNATQIIKGMGDKAKRSGSNSFAGLLGKMNLIPSAATIAAGGMAALGVSIQARVREAAEFEVALDNVNTVLNLSEQGIRQYGQGVTDMVRDLKMGISSTEALAGSYEVASAGFTDAADSQEVLRAALIAAKGGMTDAGTAVDGMTSVLNAYKLSASEATRVSDLMFQAVMDGKIDAMEAISIAGSIISAVLALRS